MVYLLVAARLPDTAPATPRSATANASAANTSLVQVVKAYYLKGNKFVAIKRINVFEKVA